VQVSRYRHSVYDDARPLSDRTPEDVAYLAQIVTGPLAFDEEETVLKIRDIHQVIQRIGL
jgi:hypothetical protein